MAVPLLQAEKFNDLILGSIAESDANISAEYQCMFCTPDVVQREVNFGRSSYAAFRNIFWNRADPRLGGALEFGIYSVSATDPAPAGFSVLSMSGQGFWRLPVKITRRADCNPIWPLP